MYLSRLKLNPAVRKTRELMISPYQLHQAIYHAFPKDGAGEFFTALMRISGLEQYRFLFNQKKSRIGKERSI